jgi:asparagine synthase (glutamine-hydrolysing)
VSGVCGWFSREPAAVPIAQMAAPLCRFDLVPVRTASHSLGAAAVAGGIDGGALYHEDGLLIAHWGERVEALARLWRSHGVNACAALSGHFAFAILDERSGEALLAVDRCATRPLLYQVVGHTLLFASSADALVQHPGAGRDIDPQALFDYLFFHAVPGSATMYKGPRRLAPGEFVHLHGGRLDRGRYWRLRFQENQPEPASDLEEELRDTLRGAVQDSLGQQQVGVMLGGGAASAALAALLRNASGDRIPTYSVSCESGSRAGHAASTPGRRQQHRDHHHCRIGPGEAADAIPRLAAAFDQPCGHPGALPAFYCAQMAREGGTQRLLAGHGAAELFGRRERYALQLRLARYERLPSALRQLLIEPLLFRLGGAMRRGPLAAARGYVEQAMRPLPERLQHANLMLGYGSASVLDPAFLAAVDPSAPHAMFDQSWWLVQGRTQVNRMIALDLQYALVEQSLPAHARACELAGVAGAYPYLNDAVVAFAARLDPAFKRDGARGLLPAALRGTLQRRTLAARGQGFALPFGQWLQSDARLRSLAFDSLSDLRRRGIVRADFVDTLLTHHLPQQPGRHGTMVWVLMMLEQWFAQRRPAGSGVHGIGRAAHAAEAGSH